MADYNSYKIQIFPGINDVSVYPSATSGGNISHFYDNFNQLIDALNSSITNIENEIAAINALVPAPEPVLDIYEFVNINALSEAGEYRGTVGTIPKTGRLQKIVIDDLADGYGTFFIVDGNYLTYETFETVQEGYQWTFFDDSSSDVTQGQEIILDTTGSEINRTIYLHILG